MSWKGVVHHSHEPTRAAFERESCLRPNKLLKRGHFKKRCELIGTGVRFKVLSERSLFLLLLSFFSFAVCSVLYEIFWLSYSRQNLIL